MTSCVSQRCHNYMTEQLGLPVWGSYIIFGLATLFSGLALGLVSGNRSVLEYKWHPTRPSLLVVVAVGRNV